MAGYRAVTLRSRLAGAALGLALAAGPAAAQDAAAPQLRLDLTPYLWVAGLSGSLRTPLPDRSGQEVSARFGDVLDNLNAIPLMGAAELRYGRFGVTADILAISVKADLKPVNGPLYAGGDVQLTQVIGSALFSARVLDTGVHTLDLGLGVRAFGLSTKFSLDAGLLPGTSKSPGATWADPLIGLRYHVAIAPRWGATLAADFGATSSTQQTWQLLGTADYQIGESTVLRAGYRHLSFSYGSVPVHQNMHLSGPIVGATFRF
ncbi:hypothetical protein ACFQS7_06045 [Dankookia sp. GCM10030260]|uniref:hypothetical protein n=1 Tax=Dankookia sp. GCM10030260 TaxID=3273390 RepID=UPI00360A4B54